MHSAEHISETYHPEAAMRQGAVRYVSARLAITVLIVGAVLIADVARVWPDDRLVGDLGMGQVDGLDAHFFDADLRTRFGVSVLGLFKEGDPSVRQVIDYISRHMSPDNGMPECDPAVRVRAANPWWNWSTSSVGFLILAALLAVVFVVIALL